MSRVHKKQRRPCRLFSKPSITKLALKKIYEKGIQKNEWFL